MLHRKRPHLIPLYDKNIKRVYFEAGPYPRLSFVPGRSWEGYAAVWIEAVRNDLRGQAEQWKHLAGLAKEPEISPLRAFDNSLGVWARPDIPLSNLPVPGPAKGYSALKYMGPHAAP